MRGTLHWWRWWLGLAFLVVGVVAAGCLQESSVPSLEQQAQALDRQLICPVCPGETIDQSRADLAKQMRVIVREKLAGGEPPDQILQFFVDRYGPSVLAEPPRGGFNLLAWVVPPLAVVGGLVVLWLVMRRMSSPASRPKEPEQLEELPVDPELEPFLAEVDQEVEGWLRTSQGEGAS
jgi:cytochrome c-type biogenesis protein CcmH